MNTQARLIASGLVLLAAFLGEACHPGDVSISDFKADPQEADKGETVRLAGRVGSLEVIKSVSLSVADGAGKPATGISITANKLGTDKTTWDLRDDADAKIVTKSDAPSGKYQIKIEAKTNDQTQTETIDFTVR